MEYWKGGIHVFHYSSYPSFQSDGLFRVGSIFTTIKIVFIMIIYYFYNVIIYYFLSTSHSELKIQSTVVV